MRKNGRICVTVASVWHELRSMETKQEVFYVLRIHEEGLVNISDYKKEEAEV